MKEKEALKNYLLIFGILVTICLYSVARIYGAVAVSEQTVADRYGNGEIVTQTTTALSSDEVTIFSTRKIYGYGFTLYVLNTGETALTTLEIKMQPDPYANPTMYIDLGDKASSISTVENVGCTDTLAAGATCMLKATADDSLQYLNVEAASTTDETSIKVILFHNTSP